MPFLQQLGNSGSIQETVSNIICEKKIQVILEIFAFHNIHMGAREIQ